MIEKINILKLVKGLELSNDELNQLYIYTSNKIDEISKNDSCLNYYFEDDLDTLYYYLLSILHRSKAPFEQYKKYFRLLKLSNPYSYHYNVWASLCNADWDSADFNVDYSYTLKKMFDVVVQSYMHSKQEVGRSLNSFNNNEELYEMEWGNPSWGEWGGIKTINDFDSLTWSEGYVNYSLFWFLKARFETEKLPSEIYYALANEVNWRENNTILARLENVGLRISSEKQLIPWDENNFKNPNYEISGLMMAFLIFFHESDILNLKKVIHELSTHYLFSSRLQNLNDVFSNLDVIQAKGLKIDFLEIYKLIYDNAVNIEQLNRLFKVEEFGEMLLKGIQSLNAVTNDSYFILFNGKSFTYNWHMYEKNDDGDEHEEHNFDLAF